MFNVHDHDDIYQLYSFVICYILQNKKQALDRLYTFEVTSTADELYFMI